MPNEPELTAYAATINIKTTEPCKDAVWEKSIALFFDKIAQLCQKQQVLAIGHIKGFLKLDSNAGYCYFSTTGTSVGTQMEGQLYGTASVGQLDFNVLVYGIDKTEAERIVNEALPVVEQELNARCRTQELVNRNKSA